MINERQNKYIKSLRKTQNIPLAAGIILIVSIVPVIYLGMRFLSLNESTHTSVFNSIQRLQVSTPREAGLQKALLDAEQKNYSLVVTNVKSVIFLLIMLLCSIGVTQIIISGTIKRLLNIMKSFSDS